MRIAKFVDGDEFLEADSALLQVKASTAECTFEKFLHQHMELVAAAVGEDELDAHDSYIAAVEVIHHLALSKMRSRIADLEQEAVGGITANIPTPQTTTSC